MRDVGLAIAVIIAMCYGGRLMGTLDIWLESGHIQSAEGEEGQDRRRIA